MPNINKIRIILLTGLFFVLPLSGMAFSQDSLRIQLTDTLLVEEEAPILIYAIEEPPPTFPGGTPELLKFFSKNIKYPIVAQEAGIEGKVLCRFTVNIDGSIVDIKIVKSNSRLFNKEVVKVMNMMPKWSPGKARGLRRQTHFEIIFVFKLIDPANKEN